MRVSPLSLVEYFTTQLAFEATANFSADSSVNKVEAEDLEVEVKEFRQNENPLDRACQIKISLKDSAGSKYPYSFSISLTGFFEVLPDWPTDKIDLLVSTNAPAMLYSAARQTLLAVTGTGPHSKLLIPSVTFLKVESNEGQETPSSSQTTAVKKTIRKQRKS